MPTSHPPLAWGRPALLALIVARTAAANPVEVTPPSATLPPGGTCTFQAHLAVPAQAGSGPGAPERKSDTPAPGNPWVWSRLPEGVGAMDPDTGAYTAPAQVDQACLVEIKVRHRDAPNHRGSASITLLPSDSGAPLGLLCKVLGLDLGVRPFTRTLPFLDLATDRRFDEKASVAGLDSLHGLDPEHYDVSASYSPGYGQPFTLAWEAVPGAVAQMISYWEGQELVQLQVPAEATSRVLEVRAPVRSMIVESLTGKEGAWGSRIQQCQVAVRGLMPCAGNAQGGPGQLDGLGLSARFREPFAVVAVEREDKAGTRLQEILVSDRDSHTIRLIGADGRVTTLCGAPGDDKLPLRHPTFMLGEEFNVERRPTWNVYLADTGNHCIRLLTPGGGLSAWAGTGESGWLDGKDNAQPFRLQARFNRPMGLAQDRGGMVYVADQGNHVIRRITPRGHVDTLAGAPGRPGTDDGKGSEARFSNLKGMVCARDEDDLESLWVLDGHALRKVTLPDGVTTTLTGLADGAGFLDFPTAPEGKAEEARAARRMACFNDPMTLAWGPDDRILITDQGNHALRSVSRDGLVLTTLIGHPGHGTTRWGLLGDGAPLPPGPAHGTLESPKGLWVPSTGPCLVTTGRGVAQAELSLLGRDRVQPPVLVCPQSVVRNQPFDLRFAVMTTGPFFQGEATSRPFNYTLERFDPGGAPAGPPLEGKGLGGEPLKVQGTFGAAGNPGRIVLRVVTDQGVATWSEAAVVVQ